jgi:hypothetical protein
MAPPGAIHPDNAEIVRFQPVGMSQSACFTKSDGRLTCLSCHDPHEPAATDRSAYEAACLNCHGPGTRPGTACPVSERVGCIGCHMPGRDAGQGVRFTDHWIRVHPATGTGSASSPVAGHR